MVTGDPSTDMVHRKPFIIIYIKYRVAICLSGITWLYINHYRQFRNIWIPSRDGYNLIYVTDITDWIRWHQHHCIWVNYTESDHDNWFDCLATVGTYEKYCVMRYNWSLSILLIATLYIIYMWSDWFIISGAWHNRSSTLEQNIHTYNYIDSHYNTIHTHIQH